MKIIVENVFKRLLTEIREVDFREKVLNKVVSEKDYFSKIFNQKKGAFRQPFNDNDFLDLVAFLSKDNNFDLDYLILNYKLIKLYILDPMRKSSNSQVNSDIGVLEFTGKNSLTTYDIKQLVDAKSKDYKDIEGLRKVIEEDAKSVGKSNDLNVLNISNDWIIVEPMTKKGSIALGWSYWSQQENCLKFDESLTYDKVSGNGFGKNCGEMIWCTSQISKKNKFNVYNRLFTLVYFIKKNYNPEDPYRKICIGVPTYLEANSKNFKHQGLESDLTFGFDFERQEFEFKEKLADFFFYEVVEHLFVNAINTPFIFPGEGLETLLEELEGIVSKEEVLNVYSYYLSEFDKSIY